MVCAVLGILAWFEIRRADDWEKSAHTYQATLKNERDTSAKIKADYEAKSKENANVADQSYNQGLIAGRNSLASYVAPRRVRASDTASATQDHNSDIPANPTPTSTLAAEVVIPEKVLNTCDIDYNYAYNAYLWAQTLKVDK